MRSWQPVSVVALLKRNQHFKIPIYVQVLVGFVITFSRSGAYQFCPFVFGLWVTLQSRKINLGPIQWGKEKVSRFTEMLQMLDVPLWFFLLYFDF